MGKYNKGEASPNPSEGGEHGSPSQTLPEREGLKKASINFGEKKGKRSAFI